MLLVRDDELREDCDDCEDVAVVRVDTLSESESSQSLSRDIVDWSRDIVDWSRDKVELSRDKVDGEYLLMVVLDVPLPEMKSRDIILEDVRGGDIKSFYRSPTLYPVIIHHYIIRLYRSLSVFIRLNPSLSILIRHSPS